MLYILLKKETIWYPILYGLPLNTYLGTILYGNKHILISYKLGYGVITDIYRYLETCRCPSKRDRLIDRFQSAITVRYFTTWRQYLACHHIVALWRALLLSAWGSAVKFWKSFDTRQPSNDHVGIIRVLVPPCDDHGPLWYCSGPPLPTLVPLPSFSCLLACLLMESTMSLLHGAWLPWSVSFSYFTVSNHGVISPPCNPSVLPTKPNAGVTATGVCCHHWHPPLIISEFMKLT